MPVAAAPLVARHNEIIRAAHARIDGGLEERLAGLIQPILERAGQRAASQFQQRATNHLTAALLRDQDKRALSRIPPSVTADGFFGYRLRPSLFAAAQDVSSTSTMIALKPRQAEAAAIALPGGVPAPDLHVTLVYLGEIDGDLRDVADALRSVAGSHAPLAGVVGGVGRFQPPGVAILLPDVPGLVELRVAVTEALVDAGLDYARNHGFEAHITVEAAPDPETLDEALRRTEQKPLHFDAIQLVRGDELVEEIPLVGPSPITAAIDALVEEWHDSDDPRRLHEYLGMSEGAYARWAMTDETPAGWAPPYLTAAADGPPPWTPPAGDEIIDVDALVKQLRAKTDPVREAFLEAAMTPHLKEAGISFDVTNPLTAKVLAQSGSQVTNIANTTRVNVMRIISQAYTAGLSIPDTTKAIRAGMASASEWRARMIARTELAGAANGGSLAATQLVSDVTGEGYYKQWLTAPGAPHPRHEDYDGLDGQTVALDEAFDVGGESLQFPGDPDGVPEETINCRCALAYTDTPPEGAVAGPGVAPETAVSEEGAAPEGAAALDELMPMTPPVGDTVSINDGGLPVKPKFVKEIQDTGLDLPLSEMRPTTEFGREMAREAPTTQGIVKPGGHYDVKGDYHGGVYTEERKGLHQEIVDQHFLGRTPNPDAPCKTAMFTAGGGASGKGGTMIELCDGRSFPLKDLEADAARLDVGAAHDRLVAKGDEWAIRGVAKYPDVILQNPDLIKAEIPEYQQMRREGDLYAANFVHEESSDIAKVVAERAYREGYTVVIDTTGSSGKFVDKLKDAMERGYDTRVRMVSIRTNEAIGRSMERAMDPNSSSYGRFVSIQALKQAHRGASAQLALWKDLEGLDWKVYDNTEGRVVVAERAHGEQAIVKDEAKLDQILGKSTEESMPANAARGVAYAEPEAATAPASTALVQPVMLGRADGGPEARAALAAIDKVHSLPALNIDPIPVAANPQLPDRVGARLISHVEGSLQVPDRIEINPMGTHIELDVAHEVGHEIDFAYLRGDKQPILDAIRQTDAWKALSKLEGGHADYLRRDREVFARAYAQWIAERSGDETMLAQLEDALQGANEFGLPDTQWARDDFAPVAAQFDRIFGGRGLYVAPSEPFTVAGSAADAVDALMEGLVKSETLAGKTPTADDLARARKSWEKQARGNVITDPAVLRAVQDAGEYNLTSETFKAATDKYGADVAIVVRSDIPAGNLLNPGGDFTAAARRTGNRVSVIKENALGIDRTEIVPGDSGVMEHGGVEAILRHEYGHQIETEISAEERTAFRQALPPADEVRRDLSYYAAQGLDVGNAQEAFSELFAVVSDPAYRPAAWPPWVQDLGARFFDAPTEEVSTPAAAAKELIDKAAAVEPSVTPELVGIARSLGGDMAGLDFRLKSQASLERKINADVRESAAAGRTQSHEEAAAGISDALRYTMVFPDDKYGVNVGRAIARLQEKGYREVKLKNFWGNDDYQGINGVFEKKGQRMEIQFHTPKSLDVKERALHPLYEQYRVETDPAKAAELWDAMAAASKQVPVPSGAGSVGQFVRHMPPAYQPTAAYMTPSDVVVSSISKLDPSGAKIEDKVATLGEHLQFPDDTPPVFTKVVGNIEGWDTGTQGIFDASNGTITLRRLGNPGSTFVHEFGHYLDNLAARDTDPAKGSSFATMDPRLLRRAGLGDWWKAVSDAPTVKRVQAALDGTANEDEMALVKVGEENFYRRSVEYALDPNELFARYFEQWFAQHDPATAAHVAERLPNPRLAALAWYLPEEEFAPISDAFDAFFRAKGWLKSPE